MNLHDYGCWNGEVNVQVVAMTDGEDGPNVCGLTSMQSGRPSCYGFVSSAVIIIKYCNNQILKYLITSIIINNDQTDRRRLIK